MRYACPQGVKSINDFFLDISKDIVPGHDSEFKFGRSTLVTTSESVVWDNGGNYVFLTGAELMDVVSTSGNDAAAGSGAQSIILFGLDANYNEVSEVIIPTGVAPVTTINSYLRVFRAIVITSGTSSAIGNANEGDITISGNTTATVQAKILIGNGQTLMAVYTIPADKTGYITGISLGAGQGKQCYFRGKFRNGPDSTFAFSVKFALDLYENSFFGDLQIPLRVPEKTDIVITGETSAGTIDATASFGVILIDN